MDEELENSEEDILGINDEPVKLRTQVSSKASLKASLALNKYHRLREIHNLQGFVVNVHDAINFDIDFGTFGCSNLRELYREVISSEYSYKDLPRDFLENPDLRVINLTEQKQGTTYRCRLRGIGLVNQESQHWLLNQVCVDVKQLIDRSDAWVVCVLSDIDVYRRLLVDIVVQTSLGKINLADYLLDKLGSNGAPLFYPYLSKR